MKTPILMLAGPDAAGVPSNSATRFIALAAGSAQSIWASSRGAADTPMPADGTLRDLYVRLPVALTSGQSWQFVVHKNGVDTGLTVTITSTGLTASDNVNTVSVVKGDLICLKSVPSSTPNAQSAIQASMIFEGDNASEGCMFFMAATGTTASFMAPGCSSASNSTEALRTGVMPTAGTVDELRVQLSAAPGTSNSRTFAIRKNGVDTGLTLTISNSATSGSATGTSVSWVAGDTISLNHTISGSPASAAVMASALWKPTIDGEAVLFGLFNGGPSASAANYANLRGASAASDATETDTHNIAPVAITLSKFRADISTAPGAAKSRAFTVRQNAADTALAVTISGASDITASDTADTVSLAAGDLVNVATTPSGTPATVTFARTSCVATVDAGGGGVAFSSTDRTGQTFEGVRNTSAVQVGGAYSGTPTDIEIELIDGSDNVVSAVVSATTQSGGVYSHTFTGVPVGGPYRHRVRDDGGAWTTSTAEIFVGAVVVLWGQSQCQKLHTDDTSGLQPTSGMNNVRICTYSSQTDVSTATSTITRFQNGTVGLARITGSGAVAIANEWYARVGNDVPLLIVVCAYQGTSIEYWVSDRKGDYPTNADVTTLWGTTPTTGFAWFMAAAAKYQASAIVMIQGTADVGMATATYKGHQDTLKGMFESLYAGMAPLFLVLPHARSNDGANTWRLRNAQLEKAESGGTWRLGGWLLDWQMDGDESPHQATGSTGNIRGGTRIGRSLAKHLDDSAIDILGPQVSTCKFTDSGRTVIELTYDRDISTADSSVYAGSPIAIPEELFAISTNGGSTVGAPGSGFTAAITAARKVQLTKASGAWVETDTRVFYLYGVPFSSDVLDSDYVGAEADMETNFLSKVITDTTSWDSNRGVPASPIMGTGRAVLEFDAGSGGAARQRPRLSLGLGLR